jgi:hypothetical protein
MLLRLKRGLRRYYTLICATIVPQIGPRFNTQFGNLLPAVEKARGCAIIALKGAKRMAWHTVQATGDLWIKLYPSGEADNQPLLKIRSTATEGEAVV